MAGLVTPASSPRARLRALLAQNAPVTAPGAYDALSARLVEEAGFDAVYMTGFGATASLIGRPDVGLLSGSEMADSARRIVSAVDVPVIADADTGYGNAVNVLRTIQLYEQAGVAGVQLEDQVMPKKCGHMSGKLIISAKEMVGKIHAAVDARRDPDLVIIARTDAIAVDGLAAAIERAGAFAAAGADLLFVEAPASEEDIATVATELRGVAPLVFNWAEGGKTPPLPAERIAELGFSLILYPIGTLLAATAGIRTLLASLRCDGVPALDGLPAFGEFTDFIGLPEVQALEQRYAPAERLPRDGLAEAVEEPQAGSSLLGEDYVD
jgi:2-methylisocitrate lyase-like PEP mutase family enzyme